VAERALNYMHTGNVAVIATSVMNPLWVGNAIICDGLPCFNSKIVSLRHNTVSVVVDRWPFDHVRHHPKTSSKAAQIFSYGTSHFNVSAVTLLLLLRHVEALYPLGQSAYQGIAMCGCFVPSGTVRLSGHCDVRMFCTVWDSPLIRTLQCADVLYPPGWSRDSPLIRTLQCADVLYPPGWSRDSPLIRTL
jgi:hypothetical protein